MAEICTQCMASVGDRVGLLAEVTDKVKAVGVNILAICAWREGDTGKVLLVTSDNQAACQAISPLVDECSFGEVVCAKVANEPGGLDAAAAKLAEAGIGIKLVYASPGDAPDATIVFDTDDNARAAELI